MLNTKYAILIALAILAIAAKSQDVIFLKNGEEIPSIVKEVTETSIKYIRADNISGPLYSTRKAEVFMVKYENGTKDVFPVEKPMNNTRMLPPREQLPPPPSQPNPNNDKFRNYNFVKDRVVGTALVTAGSILIPTVSLPLFAAGSMMVYSASRHSGHQKDMEPMGPIGALSMIAGVAVLGGSVAMVAIGAKKIKRSKKFEMNNRQNTSMNLSLTPTGVGYALNF